MGNPGYKTIKKITMSEFRKKMNKLDALLYDKMSENEKLVFTENKIISEIADNWNKHVATEIDKQILGDPTGNTPKGILNIFVTDSITIKP